MFNVAGNFGNGKSPTLALKNDLLLQTLRDRVLFNFPAYDGLLLSTEDMRAACQDYAAILVVDQ